MKQYNDEDLKIVTENFLNSKRRPVTSELFKHIISNIAKDTGLETHYTSKYPYTAIWKINSNCNLRCKHCYFYDGEQYNTENDLSTEKIYEIIKQLANAGIVEIRLTGGEVFLRKDIFQIIEYIKSFNIAIIIATNGTTLKDKEIKKAAELLSPKTDFIRISLDGADAATNDFTRGDGNFIKTVNTIKCLVKENINVFVSTTITKQNVKQLNEIYKFSESLGVQQITFIKIFPISKTHDALVPDFGELVTASADIYKKLNGNEKTYIDNRLFAASNFIHERNSKEKILKEIENKQLNKDNSKKFHCNEDKSFYIDSDGFVYLCPLAADYKLFPLGDLKEETIEEIFKKRDENLLFQKRDLDKSICGHCEIGSFCRGGCMVISYLKSKDINAPSGNCCFDKKELELTSKIELDRIL